MHPAERTVVLITGCSSGIGLHLAVRLASDPSGSFKVYATMRDLAAQGALWEAARARHCPPGTLETLQLDVRDSDSVAAARARVVEGRVDVLGEGPPSARAEPSCAGTPGTGWAGRTLGRLSRSVQRGPRAPWAAGSARAGRCGLRAGRERGGDRADGAGLPAGHEAARLGTRAGDWERGRPDGAALQRCVLCQQVRAGGSVREPGGSAAALRGPREPHRVRPGAHRLPREAGGRPGGSAGPHRRPHAPALLALPAALRAGGVRRAGPGGGGRARPALFLHGALPTSCAPAPRGPERPQLRGCHAPRRVRRRPRGWGVWGLRAGRRPL
ncbi:estradiol 17-beta-dehydrogenase 1 isoform X2 [Heterocephalus glaber]|uniref:Estradiol 17-beta-dehydrogenase 1 isoform X2 n=1 Tax=Heterocephalus glaber TaxID=10181 RepID=A0AAX6RIE3_HETGA|nr:estradiol 17-beta-dehydrogenase 1 isoform X2 [Heterocephalus glaber]